MKTPAPSQLEKLRKRLVEAEDGPSESDLQDIENLREEISHAGDKILNLQEEVIELECQIDHLQNPAKGLEDELHEMEKSVLKALS